MRSSDREPPVHLAAVDLCLVTVEPQPGYPLFTVVTWRRRTGDASLPARRHYGGAEEVLGVVRAFLDDTTSEPDQGVGGDEPVTESPLGSDDV
jgi:hypothetical protein